jgi:hypothetical protein
MMQASSWPAECRASVGQQEERSIIEHVKSTRISRRLMPSAGVFRGSRNACSATVNILINVRICRAHCRERVANDSMNSQEQFCNSNYAAKMDIAEPELSAFISAVAQLFGPEEAKLSGGGRARG